MSRYFCSNAIAAATKPSLERLLHALGATNRRNKGARIVDVKDANRFTLVTFASSVQKYSGNERRVPTEGCVLNRQRARRYSINEP